MCVCSVCGLCAQWENVDGYRGGLKTQWLWWHLMVREHIINNYFSFSDVYFAYFVRSVHVWVKKEELQ